MTDRPDQIQFDAQSKQIIEQKAPADPFAWLPRWKCHKIVHAAKIIEVILLPWPALGWAELVLETPPPGTLRWTWRVAAAYMQKHAPHAGGYFVVYEDGYESFSPAAAFERGYKRIRARKTKE